MQTVAPLFPLVNQDLGTASSITAAGTSPSDDLRTLALLIAAALLIFGLAMLRRALRPIKDILIPLMAGGLGVIAIGAAVIFAAVSVLASR